MTDLFDEQFGTTQAPEAQAIEGRRRSNRRRAAQRRAQRRRNVVTFVVMVASIALLVGGAFVLIRPLFEADPDPTVTDFDGPGSGEVEVVVNNGDTGTDIGTPPRSRRDAMGSARSWQPCTRSRRYWIRPAGPT